MKELEEYTKEITPRTFTIPKEYIAIKDRPIKLDRGFNRDLTISDFYDVFSKITDKRHYPTLRPTYVRILTEEMTISDINNLKGMSETKRYRNLSIDPALNSFIYLESDDRRFAGRIESGNPSKQTSTLNHLSNVGEMIGSLMLFANYMGGAGFLSFLGGTLLCFDSYRRIYNSVRNKNIIKVKAGSPSTVTKAVAALEERLEAPFEIPQHFYSMQDLNDYRRFGKDIQSMSSVI